MEIFNTIRKIYVYPIMFLIGIIISIKVKNEIGSIKNGEDYNNFIQLAKERTDKMLEIKYIKAHFFIISTLIYYIIFRFLI